MSCMEVEDLERKILGITMGDPAGVGPEITVRALANTDVCQRCRPLVIGDGDVLERAAHLAAHGASEIHRIKSVKEAYFLPGVIDVYDLGLEQMDAVEPGKVSAIAGEAAFRCVEKAVRLAMDGEIDGTVTNPICKEAINLAGHHYSGHTEIYAAYTGTKHYAMMLACGNLKVAHVSTHVSLREACDLVKEQRVLDVTAMVWRACRAMGISDPVIGVAGLNPHSGENGMFGREEMEEIGPAIARAREMGIRAEGPVPPDTVFSKAIGGWYDAVVAMYHDQGHIPVKVKGFVYKEEEGKWDSVSGVNITLGLPIIRTSVDHGTAFDLAGTGKANEKSLMEAIEYGIMLAEHFEGGEALGNRKESQTVEG